MCLEKLSDFKIKLDKNGVGIGWKLFYKSFDGKLVGDFKSCAIERKTNKWLKEGDFRPPKWKSTKKIKGGPPFYLYSYPLGFHIFLGKEGAINWTPGGSRVIIQIKFRKPVAKGLQYGYRCVVAKEIFIPKEAKHA